MIKIFILILIINSLYASTFPLDLQYLTIIDNKIEITAGYHQQREYGKHRAIDISAPIGTPVKAYRKGIVTKISHQYYTDRPAYGNYIVIKLEDGRSVLYAHLNTTNVVLNQRISENQLLGFVGYTGLPSPAAHLHIELRDQDNKKIYFTKELGEAARELLGSDNKYTFTLRKSYPDELIAKGDKK